jgi:hypothetical protein
MVPIKVSQKAAAFLSMTSHSTLPGTAKQTASLLTQPEKLLRARDGIGHGVPPVDDDGGWRIGGPDRRWTWDCGGLQCEPSGIERPCQNNNLGERMSDAPPPEPT